MLGRYGLSKAQYCRQTKHCFIHTRVYSSIINAFYRRNRRRGIVSTLEQKAGVESRLTYTDLLPQQISMYTDKFGCGI